MVTQHVTGSRASDSRQTHHLLAVVARWRHHLNFMLSDLSPGDKLSLKGKIFELQKKLQIIDIRNRQKEEFSYKPTLYNYDLPNRDNNVLDSINKAEIIRKVRAVYY